MTVPEDELQGLFPIRTVSSITGVNAITLRAWERRYGLIIPKRTAKGHRLYTQNDIDVIQQVLAMLEKGISIGQVKQKLQSAQPQSQVGADDNWGALQRRMINAIVRFDGVSLDQVYNEALSVYPVEMVTECLILPLLVSLGERWQTAEGSIAEEHFFGAYLRNKLGARFHHQGANPTAPKIVAACVPGEHHEIGLMLFCLSLIHAGFQVVYLGADTPFSEIRVPVAKTQALAVVLSGSVVSVTEQFAHQMTEMVNGLEVPVFIGGNIATYACDSLKHSGVITLGLNSALAVRKIRQALDTAV